MTDLDDLEARIDATEVTLRDWCERNGRRVLPTNGGEVSESTAAVLLRYAGPSALRMQANAGKPCVKYSLFGVRRMYRLRDIAAYLARDPDEI
ncbi:hypothetical protein ABH945_001782 [Paraburkholderia sp. GAS333]|uniref:hypothetical protein n=1 Tax=Paraburkholderia sp. GAS333 TaxID=3156279 RepID=UPI003D1FED8A